MNKIPTYEEISPSKGEDLEERWAVDEFLGKDIEQTKRMFMERNPIERMSYMGPVAYAYYFQAIYELFRDNQAQEAFGTVELMMFANVFWLRFAFKYQFSVETLNQMKQVTEWALERFDQYVSEYDDEKCNEETKASLAEMHERICLELNYMK